MTRFRISTGTAIAAVLLATSAQAQQAEPESLLPTASQASQSDAATPRQQDNSAQTVSEAFGDIRMASGEVVQEIPSLEGVWTKAQAEKLLAFIPTVAAEGLNPSDYRADALRTAIAAGEGEALNKLASETFVWLVEDLRDGRTPMEARRQWFVVDPDADRMPTWKLL